MANNRKATGKPARVAPEDDSAMMEFPELFTAEDVNPALESIYAEMGVDGDGQQANVYVYKETGDGGDARIWTGSPDDYNLETLTKKFGSGNYRVKIYVRHESGRMVVKANQVIKILLDPAEDQRIAQQRNPAPNAAPALPAAPNPAELAQAIAAAIKAAMPPPVAQADPMQQMAQLANIMKTMMPQPAAPQPAAPQMNPLEMFKMGVELARDSGGGDVDPFSRLIDKFAPALLHATMQQPQQSAPVAPAYVENPAPRIPAQPQTQSEDDPMLALKMGVAHLVRQARADNDPATYAAVVLDNVPQEAIAQLLTSAEWFEYLCGINAEVRNYSAWFHELREAIQEENAARSETPPDDTEPAAPPAVEPSIDTPK